MKGCENFILFLKGTSRVERVDVGNSTFDETSTSVDGLVVGDQPERPTMDTASIFGLIIWFFCILYSSIRSSSITQTAR